ncbi:hypothetical protein [Actinacidiphila soli]|uniref:hypothetical protein n=1 Tax=Actinacidiphila soli TaxID=2487275 RepID=UPI00389967A2
MPLALGGGDEFLREGAHAPGVTKDPANPLFAEFGYNELKGCLRAHPRTAAITPSCWSPRPRPPPERPPTA